MNLLSRKKKVIILEAEEQNNVVLLWKDYKIIYYFLQKFQKSA